MKYREKRVYNWLDFNIHYSRARLETSLAFNYISPPRARKLCTRFVMHLINFIKRYIELYYARVRASSAIHEINLYTFKHIKLIVQINPRVSR